MSLPISTAANIPPPLPACEILSEIRACAENEVGGRYRRRLSPRCLSPLAQKTGSFLNSARALLFLIVCALLFGSTLAHARNTDLPQRIPLAPFGFQTISERYLLEGATMLTVDFVDDTHLLVTFGVSRLMLRMDDCPEDDADRTVKAVLLELPSGREISHTEWRFHDLGQYLWNLGEGHFLLRNRDTLTTFAPIQNLSSGAFVPTPFLQFSRRIEAIVVSADHDLLAIETVKHKRASVPVDSILQTSGSPTPTSSGASQTQGMSPIRRTGLLRRDPDDPTPDPKPIEIALIRLFHKDITEVEAPFARDRFDDRKPGSNELAAPKIRVVPALAARIRTEKVVNIPLTTEGFLETRAESRNGVLFHFVTFAGKDIDLGDFATSCHPRPTFISHSEFVTYGCRGSDDSIDLAGFNLRGDLIWQLNFTDMQAYPSFASAPAAGRFAFSHTITTSNVFGSETPSLSQLTAQEIRVIQTYNGKQLVRAVANPIQRAGQNYALSPNGLALAVVHDVPATHGDKTVHDPAIEIFRLPPLSSKDLAELKTEAAMAPQAADVPMRLSLKEIKAALTRKPGDAAVKPDAAIVGDQITGGEVDDLATGGIATGGITADAGKAATGSRIVGDSSASETTASSTTPVASASAAASKGVLSHASIPASDAVPACADLSEKPAAACAVKPPPAATEDPVDDPALEKRRKPPTLYEPAPPQ